MLLWVSLLMVLLYWSLDGAAAGGLELLERIEKCQTHCSQGLRCKSKPDYFFPPPCEEPADGLKTTSVFHNISLSTVMRCEGKQRCSLHLRIKTVLQLADSIQGVSMCTSSAGMMSVCQVLTFTRASRERMSGLEVEVENDCTHVSPSQQMQITVKTVPSYCGVTWTDTYQAPDCSNEDLRKHVPECITGRLSYKENPEKKELRVIVSDMMENHDYHLRLCHKDFICIGTGANTLIKKEQPLKSATFKYSQPLPCLCIEGWSAVMDARRVQVCPFRDRLEELWTGITFDPVEETLIWESACPVTAVASLCQKRMDSICVDLPDSSQNVTREKITFSKVDPHPELCVKFTAGSQSWTRCPFADRRLQAWEVVVRTQEGQEEVMMSSQITASFSVGLCVTSAESAGCHTTETHSIHVVKHKTVDLNLEGRTCNFCVQVKRLDVKYAVAVIHCLESCNEIPTLGAVIGSPTSHDLTGVVLITSICLCGFIIVLLLLHALLTVHRRKNQKRNEVCSSQKQTDPVLDCEVSASQSQPILHRGVFIPDSLQSGNNEKANLISN